MKTYEALIAMSLISGSANATDFSFAGNFKHRNEVQELNFTVAGTAKEVVLRTWSFAGGTNAEGAVIEHGGFDPMVTLFDASGIRIGFSDDGGTLARTTLPVATPGTRSSHRFFPPAVIPPP